MERHYPTGFYPLPSLLGRPLEIAAPPWRREWISRGRSPLRGGADHVCVARQGELLGARCRSSWSSSMAPSRHRPAIAHLPLEPCARARRLTLLVTTTGRGRNASLPVGLPPCRRGRSERRGKTENDFLEQIGRWFRWDKWLEKCIYCQSNLVIQTPLELS
jgi:hypothetical protein